MSEQLPIDAIELQKALETYGHSRLWFRNRMAIYYVGSPQKAYVSDATAKAEHEKSLQVTVRRPNDD